MQKFMKWMTEDFSKAMNKITRNPWVAGIQDALLTALPAVFIGSLATIGEIIGEYISWFPDLSKVNMFSFGLMSLFLAYLIPEAIMTRKRERRISKQAGMAGIAFYLMILVPQFDDSGNIILEFGNLGSTGMIAALFSGIFVSFIMSSFSKIELFSSDGDLPDFITVWFDTLLPMSFILIVGFVFSDVLNINLYDFIYSITSPLVNIGQSFWGFLLINFLGFTFLYSFGISTWVLYPVMVAVTYQAFGDNEALIQAGKSAKYIHTVGVETFFTIGGGGMTLALNLMMLRAKSKKVRAIGKASIIPSLANINEPIVYGAPIVFNPILMIPMWINGLIIPTITYVVMKMGLVPIPTRLFGLWYLPGFISAYIQSGSFVSVIYWFILFAISFVIYLPFFRVYDRQEYEKEQQKEGSHV